MGVRPGRAGGRGSRHLPPGTGSAGGRGVGGSGRQRRGPAAGFRRRGWSADPRDGAHGRAVDVGQAHLSRRQPAPHPPRHDVSRQLRPGPGGGAGRPGDAARRVDAGFGAHHRREPADLRDQTGSGRPGAGLERRLRLHRPHTRAAARRRHPARHPGVHRHQQAQSDRLRRLRRQLFPGRPRGHRGAARDRA